MSRPSVVPVLPSPTLLTYQQTLTRSLPLHAPLRPWQTSKTPFYQQILSFLNWGQVLNSVYPSTASRPGLVLSIFTSRLTLNTTRGPQPANSGLPTIASLDHRLHRLRSTRPDLQSPACCNCPRTVHGCAIPRHLPELTCPFSRHSAIPGRLRCTASLDPANYSSTVRLNSILPAARSSRHAIALITCSA